MCPSTGRLLLGMIIIVGLGVPQPADGRTIGSGLDGRELLVEMQKVGQGPNPAGIYAWSSGGAFKRVVVYGRRPRWAPNHDSFLYWEDGVPWLAPRSGEPAAVVSLRGLRISGEVEWTPDGSHLVWKRYKKRGDVADRMSWYLVASPVTGATLPFELTPGEEQEYVGRWSVSSDGRHVAYERLDLVAGLGAINVDVAVSETATRNGWAAAEVIGRGLMSMQPSWQPGGKLIEMDIVDKLTKKRRIALVDSETRAVRWVTQLGVTGDASWPAEESWECLRWRPQGDELAILHHGRYAGYGEPMLVPMGPATVYIVPVLGDGEVAQLSGPEGRIVDSAWSPDGSALAIAKSYFLDWSAPKTTLMVWYRDRDRKEGADWTLVEVPSDLAIVDLDW